jgi:hypothetical protein
VEADAAGNPTKTGDPLLSLIWFGLGNVNTGLIVNALSDDYKWRAVSVAALTTAGAAAVWVLRRKVHPKSKIGRRAPFALLVLAMISAMATTVDKWATPASLIVVALITIAVLVPGDIDNVWYIVAGFSFVGLGIVVIRFGVIAIRQGSLVRDGIFIGLGMLAVGLAAFGAGAGLLRRSVAPLKFSFILVGAATILAAIALIRTSAVAFGLAAAAAGVTAVGCGWGLLFHRRILFGTTVMVFGVEVLALALPVWYIGHVFGTMVAIFGLSVMCGGLAVLRRSKALAGVSVVGQGLVFIGLGVVSLFHSGALSGVIVFGTGLISVAYGTKLLFRIGTFGRIRLLIVGWSQASPQRRKVRPKRHPGMVCKGSSSASFFAGD